MVRSMWLVNFCLLGGCLAQGEGPPLPAPAAVGLPRFVGQWYVIASIPLYPERNAFNGVEHYQLAGSEIRVTYRF